MTKEELRQALSDKIQKDGIVYLVGGALGDLQGCSAYVEHTLKTPMWRTKYFGVSYWFKGITDNDIIDRVTITKRAFREIISLLPFRIKKILWSFHSIYDCEGGLKSRCLKINEFCSACQELIKAGLKAAKGNKKIIDLVYCFAMFLQFSPTYRIYLQDILGELNQVNFRKSPLKEIWRLKKLALKRRICITDELSFVVWLITFVVIFKRKKVCDFVSDLDIEKIKLDKADWYYCLRRGNYDFGGKELYTRLVEAEIIDEEQNNLILGL